VTTTTTAGVRSNVTITLGVNGSPDMGTDGGGGGGGGDMTGGGSHDMAGCGMVTMCISNDNCCPAGCNQTTDSDCPSVCGNGIIEIGEVCDDGNNLNGDNCDPTCQFTNTLSVVAGVADGIGRADGDLATVRMGWQNAGPLPTPGSITTDGSNFYMWIGDRCAVKKYDTSTITTVAGADGICSASTDGMGTKAGFTEVYEVEYVPNVGTAGSIFVTGDANLRKLDLATMQVSTIGTVPAGEAGMSHDATYLYLLDATNGLRKMQLSDNTVTTLGVSGDFTGLCYDVVLSNGAFYGACGAGLLKFVPGAGGHSTVTTIVGSGAVGGCKAGTLATANLGRPNAITVDSGGNFTLTDSTCNVVWYITATDVTVAAGSTSFTAGHADGMNSPTGGTLNAPRGLVYFAASASTFIADSGNHELRSYFNGGLNTRAGVWGNDHSVDITTTGSKPLFNQPIFIAPNGDGTATVVEVLPASFNTQSYKLSLMDNSLSGPLGSTVMGGVVIGNAMYGSSSSGDHTIWKYALDGTGGTYFAGVSHTTNQNPADGSLTGATLGNIVALSTDGTNLYFADGVGGTDTLVRMIDMKAGMVVTIAGTLNSPDIVNDVGQKAHFAHINGGTYVGGNLYFIDSLNDINSTMIRQLALATRTVTTLAGDPAQAGAVDGTGTAARFALIKAITTDGKSLYAMDAGFGPFPGSMPAGDPNGPTVREIELPSGRVTTMVGTRGQWTMRPGVGTAAAFNTAIGIAFDKFTHSLLFADFAEDVIVRIK
jgi:cysteine-rich repeat protein